MAENEMFDSAVRSAGDMAGVFEYDGETAYFYLCATKGQKTQRVVAAVRMMVGTPDFGKGDIEIRWDRTETKVGLFIRQILWGVFETLTGAKYGGDYRCDCRPEIPAEITNVFDSY